MMLYTQDCVFCIHNECIYFTFCVYYFTKLMKASQQTHHVETTLCECGILVTLFSTWYQRGNHVIACLVYDLYNNMAK